MSRITVILGRRRRGPVVATPLVPGLTGAPVHRSPVHSMIPRRLPLGGGQRRQARSVLPGCRGVGSSVLEPGLGRDIPIGHLGSQ